MDQFDTHADPMETSFFKYVEKRVKHLETKYPQRPKKAILSLIFWCCKQLFRSSHALLLSPEVEALPWRQRRTGQRNDGIPRILFYLNGGIGDTVIASTYLKEFHKFIGGTHQFAIVTDQNISAIQGIFHQCPWVERIYDRKEIDGVHGYDAAISLSRIPRLVYWDPKSQTAHSPLLQELLQTYKSFEKNHYKLCGCSPQQDTLSVMYSLMNGQTRRTQPDLQHKLGMSDATRPIMVIDQRGFDILKNSGLENQTYITIQRGSDEKYRGKVNIRQWPQEDYNTLIRLLHTEFPSLSIVQLGKKSPQSDLTGIDIDLRGKTDCEQLKAILKRSALHIDGECGMVHITHALQGRSAVFFGQTNIDFCGYPDNINVKAEGACPLWCEWVTNDWQARCLRGCDVPPCMEQLTPQLFFDAIQEHLHKVVNEKPATLKETDEIEPPTGRILFLGDYENESMHKWVRPENHISQFAMHLTPEMIRTRNARKIDTDYADILNIPMKKESCDAVFCSREQKLTEPALHEMTRILKTGGTLQIQDGPSYRKTRSH